jgi:hypothetical protein
VRVLKVIAPCGPLVVAIALMADRGARYADPERALRTVAPALSACLSQAAVCPALVAATFHPDGFNQAAHVAVTKRRVDPARVQELVLSTKSRRQAVKAVKKGLGWATNRKNLARYIKRHRLITHWPTRPIDPARVQEMVLSTKSRREAVKAVKKGLGWATSRNNLAGYIKRHRLITHWPKRPIDPNRVQELILTARNLRVAIKILNANLNWSTTLKGLKQYLRRYKLTHPWPQRPIDVRRVEELLQRARSREEAVEILGREWGWYTTPRNLTLFIWRHGLNTPWSRRNLSAAA